MLVAGEKSKQLFNETQVSETIRHMAPSVLRCIRDHQPSPILLLGIQQGGVPLAEALAPACQSLTQHTIHCGTLDCSFYRDDIALRLPSPRPTELPIDLEDAAVVLVDDVFDSGRTLRAALDALHEYGRPAVIRFAALVDRQAALLPLRADVIGFTIPASSYPGRIRAGREGIFLESLS